MKDSQLRQFVERQSSTTCFQIMDDYAAFEVSSVIQPDSALYQTLADYKAEAPDAPNVPDVLMAVFLALEVYRKFAYRYADLCD